jgi:hypothetical protein
MSTFGMSMMDDANNNENNEMVTTILTTTTITAAWLGIDSGLKARTTDILSNAIKCMNG